MEKIKNDKNNIRKKYNIETIDKPSIEEIMLFYICLLYTSILEEKEGEER